MYLLCVISFHELFFLIPRSIFGSRQNVGAECVSFTSGYFSSSNTFNTKNKHLIHLIYFPENLAAS